MRYSTDRYDRLNNTYHLISPFIWFEYKHWNFSFSLGTWKVNCTNNKYWKKTKTKTAGRRNARPQPVKYFGCSLIEVSPGVNGLQLLCCLLGWRAAFRVHSVIDYSGVVLRVSCRRWEMKAMGAGIYRVVNFTKLLWFLAEALGCCFAKPKTTYL